MQPKQRYSMHWWEGYDGNGTNFMLPHFISSYCTKPTAVRGPRRISILEGLTKGLVPHGASHIDMGARLAFWLRY